MKQRKTKYRIRSKFRFTIFMTTMFLMLTFATGTLLGINDAESMGYPQYHEVQVEFGDTLWNLASEYGPENTDLRVVVHQICNINHISADQLQAGQTLLIPKNI